MIEGKEETAKGLGFQMRVNQELKKDRKEYRKWTLPENLLYSRFLENNLDHEMKQKRRPRSYFVEMSKFMGGLRNNEQCRSHHRKMLLAHLSVSKIIAHIKVREQVLVSRQSTHILNQSIQRKVRARMDKACELKEVTWEDMVGEAGIFDSEKMVEPSLFC